MSAEYGRGTGGERRSWAYGEEKGSFILESRRGGDDNTGYRAAKPEAAKLTGNGNSQVLALHVQYRFTFISAKLPFPLPASPTRQPLLQSKLVKSKQRQKGKKHTIFLRF